MFTLINMNRKTICLLGMVLSVFILITYVQAASKDSARSGGEYRVPLMSEPMSLDPAIITGIYATNVAANLFDGLVEFDEDLNVVPAVARIWKISRDQRTYTFMLRKGVKFHSGREVTAEDFVYSFTRLLAPETKSSVVFMFKNIAGATSFREGKSKTISGLRALDKYSLVIELEEPFAPFLSILAMANAKVVPKEAIGIDFGKQPIGTGPFRFRIWKPGKEITLEANNAYFGGRPYLDMLRFRIYPNIEWEKVFSEFEKGGLEQSIIPSGKYQTIMSKGNIKKTYTLISKPGLNVVYIGMNNTVAPFNDVRVRQAVIYATDRKTITKEIRKQPFHTSHERLRHSMPEGTGKHVAHEPRIQLFGSDRQGSQFNAIGNDKRPADVVLKSVTFSECDLGSIPRPSPT